MDKDITYKTVEDEESAYEVFVNGRYLCKVVKQYSASRTYWYVEDAYNGNLTRKLKGTPKQYAPVTEWDQTRTMAIQSTFPLELGYDKRYIKLDKYQF